MTAPTWLINALEQCETRALDNVEDRLAVAEALVEALEQQKLVVLAAIRSSLTTQLDAEGLVPRSAPAMEALAAPIDRIARNVTTSALGAIQKTST